jgi:FixJ family two-component response regulator
MRQSRSRAIDAAKCGSDVKARTQANMNEQSQIAVQSPLIAVVDDDPAVCSSLKFSLELEGFRVRIYGSGAELLDAGDLAACRCFVIDQRMPGMSGMELIAKLRDRKVLTPAVLIISHLNAALSARAAQADVPIVEKPFLGNALVDRIREACRRD